MRGEKFRGGRVVCGWRGPPAAVAERDRHKPSIAAHSQKRREIARKREGERKKEKGQREKEKERKIGTKREKGRPEGRNRRPSKTRPSSLRGKGESGFCICSVAASRARAGERERERERREPSCISPCIITTSSQTATQGRKEGRRIDAEGWCVGGEG